MSRRNKPHNVLTRASHSLLPASPRGVALTLHLWAQGRKPSCLFQAVAAFPPGGGPRLCTHRGRAGLCSAHPRPFHSCCLQAWPCCPAANTPQPLGKVTSQMAAYTLGCAQLTRGPCEPDVPRSSGSKWTLWGTEFPAGRSG